MRGDAEFFCRDTKTILQDFCGVSSLLFTAEDGWPDFVSVAAASPLSIRSNPVSFSKNISVSCSVNGLITFEMYVISDKGRA